MLVAAVRDRDAPMRLAVVATGGSDGADARSMVLRHVDPATASLAFFTDVRAAKVATIAAAPRVTVVVYDPACRLQLRLGGTAAVATTGPAVESAWARLADAGRDAYRTVLAPGTPLPASARAGAAARTSDGGRTNFAVIAVTLDRIESLDLGVAGHRRAHHAHDGTAWRSAWLVP